MSCPSCGAPIELRGGKATQVVVCAYCDSALDARDPNLAVLWAFQKNARYEPRIPLGTRGELRGVRLEVIAFLRRGVTIEGQRYSWSEYLLYSPYKGYRWLVEYDGHWTLLKECIGLPQGTLGPIACDVPVIEAIHYGGMSFKHFQTSAPTLTYCIGEAYWRMTRDDRSVMHDFVNPPYLLSADVREGEVVWSIGEYLPEQELVDGFKMAPATSPPTGVAPCQPNPIPPAGHAWLRYLAYVCAALVITIVFSTTSQNRIVTTIKGDYFKNQKERAVVSQPFELDGRSSNVAIQVASSGLDGRWAYYKLALINEDTHEAIDFGVENSYYHGVDDGESWSEGTPSDTVYVPHVAAGHYFLRVEPESGTGSTPDAFAEGAAQPGDRVFGFEIEVKRDVTRWVWLWWVIGLLFPFPVIQAIRYSSFENRRWMESDHPPMSSSSDSDD